MNVTRQQGENIMNMCKILFCFVFTIIILYPNFVLAKIANIKDCAPTISLTITDNQEEVTHLSKAASSRLNDMIEIRNRACQTVQSSKHNADEANWYFRIVGILIIALSVCIHLISSLEGSLKILSYEISWKRIISIASLLIAFMTGANAFFDFKGTWSFSRSAQYELRYHIIRWEQKISVAQHMYLIDKNEEEFLKNATLATDYLINEWEKGVKLRAGQYFNEQKFSS